MKTNLILTRALAALAVLATVGCSDIPLLPKWDTEWSFPLMNRTTDQLFGNFNVTLTPGAPMALTFPIEHIQLGERLRDVIGQHMKSATLLITISKSMAVGGTYTLALSRDAAGLLAAPDSGIALRFSVTPMVQSNSDSATISVAGLAMLQDVADSHGTLYVQLRGNTSNTGAGNILIVPGDSISIQLSLRATIAMSN